MTWNTCYFKWWEDEWTIYSCNCTWLQSQKYKISGFLNLAYAACSFLSLFNINVVAEWRIFNLCWRLLQISCWCSFISVFDSTPGIDLLRKMVLLFHWTNVTKVVHPIPVHSQLHHKYSYIQLVFCLTNQYFFSFFGSPKHPWMAGKEIM